MTKKFITLSSAVLLSMSLLAGCSSEPAETATTEVAQATTETESTDAATAATETVTSENGITVNTYIAENGNVDSISAASVNQYYEQSSLTGEALMTSIANREGAVAVATTNPDGTPNIATVIPGVVGENHLAFGIVPNQTTNNLFGNKIAVMSYYLYEADAEDKFERNKGARLILELVEDEATIQELRTNNPDSTSDSTIFVEIVEVLPLG